MKRFPSNLLLCLSTVFLLVACRGDETPESAATPTPTATVTPAVARGEEPSGVSTVRAPAIEITDVTEPEGIIYSVPFEAQPDGFGFRNYGPGHPEGDFTITDLRELFGDGVCSRIDQDSEACIPSAEAQQWIDDRNADMRAGHCIGFTVTSYRFAQGDLQPATFTTSATDPYDIDQEASIMRTIALNGSLYWVKSVWSSEVAGTPREIIDALIDLGKPVDLSIFLPGLVGGHSLLAYGVEQVEPQTYHILVYDNNFPGEEAFVEVDYEANTWRYARGAVNPDKTAVPYEGDAATETLRFIPLSAYETVDCPFCPSDSEEEDPDEATTLITFLGQGEALVETALGSIGTVAGEIINEIPGARLIFQRGQLAAHDAPDIILPAGIDYSVEFSGLERVSGLGPNLSLAIDNLDPTDEKSRLVVSADKQSVDFQAGGEQSPLLNITVRQDDASYKVTLLGVDFADGQSLSVGAAEGGNGLELRSEEVDVKDATLLITRLTNKEETIFATTGLNIQDGGGVALDIAQWDGGDMNLYADTNGDGNYDQSPTTLPNEPLNQVLQQSGAGNIIDTLSPFMGDEGLESALAGLADQDLSGQAIGEILQPLLLTDEQLISLIPTFSLSMPEMGELLFALRLEPEREEIVIAGLDLAAEDEAELLTWLDNLALYHEIMSDWAFLNTDDLGQLLALLNEYDPTVEQLAQLLPRMGLEPSEIEWVLGGLDLSLADLADLAELLEVEVPATHTPTPTPTAALTITTTTTATATPTINGTMTMTMTPSPTAGITVTIGAGGTPTSTPATDPYPGPLPSPTGTPGSYPYPGPDPSPTRDPDAYPGPDPTATPDFQSSAFCVGDDLWVLVEEPTWEEETAFEIWADEVLLFSGEIRPDGEPFEVILPGPGTWTDLYIEASVEPIRVPLGTVTCPRGSEASEGG